MKKWARKLFYLHLALYVAAFFVGREIKLALLALAVAVGLLSEYAGLRESEKGFPKREIAVRMLLRLAETGLLAIILLTEGNPRALGVLLLMAVVIYHLARVRPKE